MKCLLVLEFDINGLVNAKHLKNKTVLERVIKCFDHTGECGCSDDTKKVFLYVVFLHLKNKPAFARVLDLGVRPLFFTQIKVQSKVKKEF